MTRRQRPGIRTQGKFELSIVLLFIRATMYSFLLFMSIFFIEACAFYDLNSSIILGQYATWVVL